jgi:hypothetical protein
MRTVKVRLQEVDLSDEMAAMRSWLDRNGFEARTFNCDQSAGEVVLSVGFMSDAAADAFAARFDVTRCHPPSARQHPRSGCTLGSMPSSQRSAEGHHFGATQRPVVGLNGARK